MGEGDLLRDIFAINENIVWGIDAGGTLDGDPSTKSIIKITYSDIAPYTEVIEYDNAPEIDMQSIHFADENTGYIVGVKNEKGAIWKNDTGINVMSTTNESLNSFKVYPNPASKEINIEVENSSNYSISLTDFSGKLIYSQSFDTYKIKINTEQFPKGTYILSVKTKEKNYTNKIIIN